MSIRSSSMLTLKLARLTAYVSRFGPETRRSGIGSSMTVSTDGGPYVTSSSASHPAKGKNREHQVNEGSWEPRMEITGTAGLVVVVP